MKIKFVTFILIICCFACMCSCSEKKDKLITKNEELKGKTIGMLTGTNSDMVINEFYSNDAKIKYYNTSADVITALDTGKVDSMVTDKPLAEYINVVTPIYRVIDPPMKVSSYGIIFKKNTKKSEKLCKEFNKFIEESNKNGLADKLYNKWCSNDNSKYTVDYKSLKNKKGVLTMATSSSMGPPYAFIRNNKFVGYDLDYAYHFCKENGYALKIEDYDFGALFAGALNKCDFAAACITITAERKESVLFTEPYSSGGYVNMVRTRNVSGADDSFFGIIKEGFERTFIREGRWKLFVDGVICTLKIIIFAVVFGAIVGTLLALIYYKQFRVFNKIMDILIYFIQGVPVVIFLMILYYIVFEKSNMLNTTVTYIAFAIIFGIDVLDLLNVSIATVNSKQKEAAYALGYSQIETFFKITIPIAMKFFLPVCKTKIKMLVKETAVVGYIAVQDITKVGDIVRSRTFDPFFSLISVTIIYFIIMAIFNIIINLTQRKLDPRFRKKDRILKGVRVRKSAM